ncbi:hypothetical protein DPMN_107997 [Dreissena polymorpha]|uniref:Uncharacterized protein n=1 Tax=Dreissena polymorpha TaxID=45954 RepID=A0A9D4K832_DREPO|nr:hypothetical protein DPMN_107997 [Dreissena polymorpha]
MGKGVTKCNSNFINVSNKQVVLYPLVTLSKTLQRENLTLADANSQMSATRTVLSQLKEE